MYVTPRKFVVLGCLALIGCEAPTSSTPRLSPDASASLDRETGVIAHASGDGNAQLPAGNTLLAFELGANQHSNGSGLGSFRQVRGHDGVTADFSGDVTCVTVDAANHRAWIGGVITANNSTDPNLHAAIHQPGRDIWFRVVDNGEGSAAAPDRLTIFGFTGSGGVTTSAEYCALQRWTAGDVNTWPLVDGNIQVRP